MVFPWFVFNFLGSQKGPRPKLRALATQVWVATHNLKTSELQVGVSHICNIVTVTNILNICVHVVFFFLNSDG